MEIGIVALAALACPIGMGLMMWFMAKGTRGGDKEEKSSDEVHRLRAEQEHLATEVERLESERAAEREKAAR